VRTLWSLAVLGLLREGPVHPYEMQRQLHLRHTTEALGLKRGSLYHAIRDLEHAGLIEPIDTTREGRWPERTVYRATPEAEEELVLWLRDLLSTPAHEPSHFVAALAHIVRLAPDDAAQQLQMRCVNLEVSIASLSAVERAVGEMVGRTSVIEVEYRRALLEAELAWVRSLIDDLHNRRLTWDVEAMLQRSLTTTSGE
jgi:DNA-binding PadR family transcriptional regulator